MASFFNMKGTTQNEFQVGIKGPLISRDITNSILTLPNSRIEKLFLGSSYNSAKYIDAIDYTGNAATATKLKAAKTISLTGLISGSGDFDGSSNLTIATSNLNLNGANIDWTGVTVSFANLPTGTGSNQVAVGNHNHDARYVSVSGDTMTGNLNIGNSGTTLSDSNYHKVGIGIRDLRAVTSVPGMFGGGRANFYFKSVGPSGDNNWKSILHMTGWNPSEHYRSWELLGPAAKDSSDNLYFRSGKDTTWGTIHKIAWFTDITKDNVGLGNVENTKLSTWTGSSNIATLGTITSGIWNGTAIDIAHGGTGAATAANARSNLGLGDASTKTVATSIDATTNGTYLPNVGAVRDYITSTVSGVYQFKGTVASVTTGTDGKITPPNGTVAGNGFVYNVTNSFNYMGETYPAGTNIVCEQETSGSTTTTLWKPLGGSFEVDLTQFQPIDGDLTAIAGLSGTSGFLKKTAANTWTLDTAPQSSSVAHSLKFSTDGSGVSAGDATFDGSEEKTISYNTVGAASSGHTHGNLTNDGKLQTNGVEIGVNDQLVITDNSDSSKVAKASIAFDASTATKYLSKKGTWEDVGVQSVSSGSANGTISVKTNGGSATDVAVKGLGSRAFDSTDYLPLAGGTMVGNISFKTTNYTSTPITVIDDGSRYGHTLRIGSGGTTYVGAGESAEHLHSVNGTSSGENLYLTADIGIFLYDNCDTIANRKGIQFTSTIFSPVTNNDIELGSSSLKWSNVWATKVNDYTLAAACAKAVDTTLSTSSANLPTSQAVATYVSTNYSPKAGSTSITTVGTITSGTWNGATIDVAHGGTGATTASGARTNLGLGAAATCGTTSSIADGTDGNLLPNVTAVKGYVAAISSGAVEYLGLADEASDLILTCGKGDYYRASAAFEISAGSTVTSKITIHAGDLIVALQDNPVNRTADYWFAVHTESDNDTKNTAGSTNSTGKLFLIGATSQGANPTTYSNSNVYAENGNLHATKFNTYALNDACAKAVDTTLTSSSTNLPTSQAVATYISGQLANYSLTSHTHDYVVAQASTSITNHRAAQGTVLFATRVSRTTAGLFNTDNDSNSVITINRHEGNYDSQLGFSSNGNIYYRSFNGSALDTTTAWKRISFSDHTHDDRYYTKTEADDRFVNVSGDTMTGDLTFKNTTAADDSPAVIFQRGTSGDAYTDWKMWATGGNLCFAQGTGNTWTTRMTLKESAQNSGKLCIGSTAVSMEGHSHPYAGSSSAGGAANSVANSITFNSSGTGAVSGTTFDGSAAKTISYNTIGAASVNDVNDSKTKVGNTQSSSKLYLIGVTSTGSTNGSNATSYYSNTNFSVTNGVMNVGNEVKSNKVSVGTVSSGEVTTKASMQYNSTDDCIEFVFA